MTGNALNLALKLVVVGGVRYSLVVLHVELQNMKHVVLHDALVEVSETRILFHWIGLKKLACKHVNFNIACALYPEIPRGGGVESTLPPQPI